MSNAIFMAPSEEKKTNKHADYSFQKEEEIEEEDIIETKRRKIGAFVAEKVCGSGVDVQVCVIQPPTHAPTHRHMHACIARIRTHKHTYHAYIL